jgi:hypothetical protein
LNVAQKLDTIENLNNAIIEKSKEKNDLLVRIENKYPRLHNLIKKTPGYYQDENKNLLDEKETLIRLNSDRNNENLGLRNEITNLNGINEELQSKYENLDKNLKKLESKEKKNTEILATLRKALQKKQSEFLFLQKENGSLNQEVLELKQIIRLLKSEKESSLKLKDDEIKEVTANILQNDVINEKNQKELGDIKSKNESDINILNSKLKELEQIKNKIEELWPQYKGTDNQLGLLNYFHNLKNMKEHLINELKKIGVSFENNFNIQDENTSNFKTIYELINKKIEEIATLTENNNKNNTRIAELEQIIQDKETEIKDLNNKLSTLEGKPETAEFLALKNIYLTDVISLYKNYTTIENYKKSNDKIESKKDFIKGFVHANIKILSALRAIEKKYEQQGFDLKFENFIPQDVLVKMTNVDENLIKFEQPPQQPTQQSLQQLPQNISTNRAKKESSAGKGKKTEQVKPTPKKNVEQNYTYDFGNEIMNNQSIIIYDAVQKLNGVDTQNKVVIKAFRTKDSILLEEEQREFEIQKRLSEDRCNVPKVYTPFKGASGIRTNYPVEKIDISLFDRLNNSDNKKLLLPEIIKTGKVIASVLQKLHSYGYFYGDISPNNIGYKIIKNVNTKKDDEYVPYLLNFGLANYLGRRLKASIPPFESRNHIRGTARRQNDDYESLGFLLYFSYIGETEYYKKHGFKQIVNSINKPKNANDNFFQHYFNILENTSYDRIDGEIFNYLNKYK